jgi:hypothetical protein
LPIAITRIGDRIRLSTLYLQDCELPVDALPIRIADNKVICTKRLLLGGVQVSGFTIYFPGSAFATEYVQRLGLVQLDASAEPGTKVQSPDGLTSQVRVRGVVAGDALTFSQCDADLTATGLTLLSPSANTPLVHFDFTSPDVAIDGTSDSFLISDSNDTALQISATSETFHRAILDNNFLRSAAHRAANSGPFVACSPTGDPVRLEAERDCLKIFKGGAPNVLLTASAKLPNLEWQDSVPLLRIGELSLSAQLPMLEGISAATLTSALIEKVRTDFHGCVSTLVGLEGKYFAYCVLGKLTESHLSITSAVAIQPSAQVTSMVSAYEQNVFLAFIVQNAALLARDLETTTNYLPAFAVDRDSDILDRVGISNALNARNVEQAYQRALAPIGSLASHIYRLDGYTSRLTSMRKALAQDEGWGKFLPLGVSAAASLVNPFALVGVAQQGVSLLSRTESRATVEQDTFNDAFESSSKEWDYIIHSLLPSVSYRLCQEIYPIRLNTSALLLSAYDRADQTTRGNIEYFVAQRFARLSAFLDFPSGLDKNLSRSQVIEFLFQLQKYAEAFGLRHF